MVNGLAENGTCGELWWGGASATTPTIRLAHALGVARRVGRRTVRIGWLIVSDEYVSKDGMWVDDVPRARRADAFEDSADTMKCDGALIDSYDTAQLAEDDAGFHHAPTPRRSAAGRARRREEGRGQRPDAGLLTGMVFLGMALAVGLGVGGVVCVRTGAAGVARRDQSGVAAAGGGGAAAAAQRAHASMNEMVEPPAKICRRTRAARAATPVRRRRRRLRSARALGARDHVPRAEKASERQRRGTRERKRHGIRGRGYGTRIAQCPRLLVVF